jgi:hypothetical protein
VHGITDLASAKQVASKGREGRGAAIRGVARQANSLRGEIWSTYYVSMSRFMVAFVGRVQADVSLNDRIHGQRRNNNVPW